MRQDIVAAALKELEWGQAEDLPFDGDYYQGLVSNFKDFAEHLGGDAGARIYTTLFPLFIDPKGDHKALLGDFLQVTPNPQAMDTGHIISVLDATNTQGQPRFSISTSSDPFRGGRAVRFTINESSDDLRSNHIAQVSVFDNDRGILGMATCRPENFPAFAAFTAEFLQAVPHLRDNYFSHSDNGLYTSFTALRDADGGVLGEHTLAAFDAYFTGAAAHVGDWAAVALQDTFEAQVSRGFVWGEKYLNYNDLDDSACAIQTGKPGRSALMHDNTSLINDHQRFIAWVDQTELRSASTLSVRMLSRDESLADAVEALVRDDLAATMEYDLHTRTVIKAANFDKTNLVQMFQNYLNEDRKLFALGRMDDQNPKHCKAKTDFDNLERISEDWDEDEDEDMPLRP